MDADGLFGHVNDSIRELATEGQPAETWEFVCECPDVGCHEMVSLVGGCSSGWRPIRKPSFSERLGK